MRISVIYIVFLLLFPVVALATHNRAGEIIYRSLGGNTIEATIITYTNTITNNPPDRPELEIFWGDGENDTLPRTNGGGNGVFIIPGTKRNEYKGTHVYNGSGTYIISFIDLNRNAGVINMQSSVNQPFYVESKIVINNSTQTNNSPVLLIDPIDVGVLGQLFIHNPNAFDPDGDSLSYEITDCKGFNGQPVPGYYLPTGSGSAITIDSYTGDFVWNTPQQIGEFNFAIIIREWRRLPNGVKINIGYVTRDFQVDIITSPDQAPQITASDTCVEANDTLFVNAIATDPDGGTITITASGGPFNVVQSPALYDTVTGTGTVIYNFSWNTVCAHVRLQPYQVVFKATDGLLSDLESINIRVIGPAPKDPVAIPSGTGMQLRWSQSPCTEAKGYYIYRKINPYGFIPGYCETGVPAYTGYVKIGSTGQLTDTAFYDDDNGAGLAPAVDYCYMIVAYYPDGAESYASVEVCAFLQRDLPVVTNVDVLSTDDSAGQIYVAWAQPNALDTIQFPAPYQYLLQRALTGTTSFTTIATFANLTDTLFTDSNLNTTSEQYKYRIRFSSNGTELGISKEASSVFLTALPGDKTTRLTWQVTVPWTNYLYYIYRGSSGIAYTLIDSTTNLFYNDTSLINDSLYCYYIESIGEYADSGLVNPIFNSSQETCVRPYDADPPCVPQLSAVADCDSMGIVFGMTYTVDQCKLDDIAYFTIYYATDAVSDFDSIDFFAPTSLISYNYVDPVNIGGCYYLTVTDTNGNASAASNIVCLVACPRYELPNVFTPDGNGINDIFHPVQIPGTQVYYRDIKDVDMKIFNRWGSLLFKTTDPFIGWNGKKNNEGEDVPDGVYFYICIVNPVSDKAEQEPIKLTGTINIYRGGNTK